MKETITLTLKEADSLLEILSELPIKYTHLFTRVQVLLADKFREADKVKRVVPIIQVEPEERIT